MTLRRTVPALALAVALGVGVGACSDDGDGGAAASTTVAAGGSTSTPELASTTATTAAPEETTTTAAEATTTTAEGDVGDDGPVIPTNAEDYAIAFIEAWATGDQETALALGTQEAVDTIFAFEPGGEEGSPAVWTLDHCEGAAGSSFCTFTAGGDPEVVVRVLNEAASLGQQHAVSEVRVDA
jgi:hypothetical protein